jgi:hypothetical protein
VQFSPYGLLLLTQPLRSSELHIRANLEFSSNFGNITGLKDLKEIVYPTTYSVIKILIYSIQGIHHIEATSDLLQTHMQVSDKKWKNHQSQFLSL